MKIFTIKYVLIKKKYIYLLGDLIKINLNYIKLNISSNFIN